MAPDAMANHHPALGLRGFPAVLGCVPIVSSFITLATKHAKSCPSGESRNPEKHWMPDQVRHDVIGIYYCRSNI
jgi:hypothetical protein